MSKQNQIKHKFDIVVKGWGEISLNKGAIKPKQNRLIGRTENNDGTTTLSFLAIPGDCWMFRTREPILENSAFSLQATEIMANYVAVDDDGMLFKLDPITNPAFCIPSKYRKVNWSDLIYKDIFNFVMKTLVGKPQFVYPVTGEFVILERDKTRLGTISSEGINHLVTYSLKGKPLHATMLSYEENQHFIKAGELQPDQAMVRQWFGKKNTLVIDTHESSIEVYLQNLCDKITEEFPFVTMQTTNHRLYARLDLEKLIYGETHKSVPMDKVRETEKETATEDITSQDQDTETKVTEGATQD